MKFIYFNPETRMVYISDPLTTEDGEIIAKGIGVFMAMSIAAVLITAIIVLPFLIVSGLDKFLISFFSVNKNFIIATAIVLVLIRFFTVRLSSTLIVRFLFGLMIIVPILYILLYKFNIADITIGVGKRIVIGLVIFFGMYEIKRHEYWRLFFSFSAHFYKPIKARHLYISIASYMAEFGYFGMYMAPFKMLKTSREFARANDGRKMNEQRAVYELNLVSKLLKS